HYDVTLKTGDEKRALLDQGWPDAEQFAQALNATATPAVQHTLDVVTACASELSALQEVVDQRFNGPAPGGAPTPDAVTFVHLKEARSTATWILERGLERRQPGTTASSGAPDAVLASSGADSAVRIDSGWSEALQLTRESRVDGLRLLQGQIAAATSGREQF